MSDRSTRLLALLALAGFVAAFILVHFVRDDLSVWHTTLSIFAVGPAGWALFQCPFCYGLSGFDNHTCGFSMA